MSEFTRTLFTALTIMATWFAAFFGPVLLVYEARGGNTLTTAQSVACVLISFPPTIIVAAILFSALQERP